MASDRPLRHRCELFARLEAQAHGPANVRVLELSEAGAFVMDDATLRDLQVGDPAVLLLALPGGDPLAARCHVSRHGSSRRELPHATVEHVTVITAGFAVEFEELPDEEIERLRDYIELLDNR